MGTPHTPTCHLAPSGGRCHCRVSVPGMGRGFRPVIRIFWVWLWKTGPGTHQTCRDPPSRGPRRGCRCFSSEPTLQPPSSCPPSPTPRPPPRTRTLRPSAPSFHPANCPVCSHCARGPGHRGTEHSLCLTGAPSGSPLNSPSTLPSLSPSLSPTSLPGTCSETRPSLGRMSICRAQERSGSHQGLSPTTAQRFGGGSPSSHSAQAQEDKAGSAEPGEGPGAPCRWAPDRPGGYDVAARTQARPGRPFSPPPDPCPAPPGRPPPDEGGSVRCRVEHRQPGNFRSQPSGPRLTHTRSIPRAHRPAPSQENERRGAQIRGRELGQGSPL